LKDEDGNLPIHIAAKVSYANDIITIGVC